MAQPTDTRVPAKRVTEDDISSLAKAANELSDFRDFLLERFADYTHFGLVVTTTQGRIVDPVDRATFPVTSAGYGRWRLYRPVTEVVLDLADGEAKVVFENFVSDDRGGSGTSVLVDVPRDFILGDPERKKRYETYLALKEEFEGGQDA